MTVELGKPLPLSDDDLDRLSKVTADDIQNARRLWIESVDDELKPLLDTTEVTE